MKDGRMNHSVLKTLPAVLILALAACNNGGASSSATGSVVAVDDSNAPACTAHSPATTLASDAPHVGDCVTYTPQKSDTEATTDRFADVANLLAGSADNIRSPEDQIRLSQAYVTTHRPTLDETRHQEDIIAASLIFTAAKETLPGVSDDEILKDMRSIPHLQITREDVGAKLVVAHAGLLATNEQSASGTPNVVDNSAAVDQLADDDRQNLIQQAADKALTRATPAVRALLNKEAVANEGCRGSTDQTTIDRECAIRDKLEAALDKAGWCYGRSDDSSAADSYWHDCKW